MPQTNGTNPVNTAKKVPQPSFLGGLVLLAAAVAVFCLYYFCVAHYIKNRNIPPVKQPESFYSHFCPCSCCKASGISPFLIKLPHYMQDQPSRLVIYAADIRQLTGCSKRTSQRQLTSLKTKLNKAAHQYVTIEEYCTDMGLNYEKTLVTLKLK